MTLAVRMLVRSFRPEFLPHKIELPKIERQARQILQENLRSRNPSAAVASRLQG